MNLHLRICYSAIVAEPHVDGISVDFVALMSSIENVYAFDTEVFVYTNDDSYSIVGAYDDDIRNGFRWLFPIHNQLVFHRGNDLRGVYYVGHSLGYETEVICDDVYLTDQTYVFYNENGIMMVPNRFWENNYTYDPILERIN